MSTSTSTPRAERAGVFPLEQGNLWVYAGNVRWTESETGKVGEKQLEWRMEVVETFERQHVRAALVRGHPVDLAFYKDGRGPQEHLLISASGENYFHLRGARVMEARARLRDPDASLGGLVQKTELFLRLPLVPGGAYGETAQLTREDAFYRWVTGQPYTEELNEIAGISGKHRIWPLSLRSLSSAEFIDFVEGVGFLRYRFIHHGTVSEFDLRLIAFRPGS